MRALRAATALLLMTAVVAVIVKVMVPRWSCNRSKGIINAAVRKSNAGGYAEIADARRLADLCRDCIRISPDDYEFLHLLGTLQLRLGDPRSAVDSYRRSLNVCQRPETYGYLALAQLQQGQVEEARRNLYRAALFNVIVLDFVSDPLRQETHDAVIARHLRLRSGKPLLSRRSGRTSQHDHRERAR